MTAVLAVPGEELWRKVELDGILKPEDGVFAAQNRVRFNRLNDVFDVPPLCRPTV